MRAVIQASAMTKGQIHVHKQLWGLGPVRALVQVQGLAMGACTVVRSGKWQCKFIMIIL